MTRRTTTEAIRRDAAALAGKSDASRQANAQAARDAVAREPAPAATVPATTGRAS